MPIKGLLMALSHSLHLPPNFRWIFRELWLVLRSLRSFFFIHLIERLESMANFCPQVSSCERECNLVLVLRVVTLPNFSPKFMVGRYTSWFSSEIPNSQKYAIRLPNFHQKFPILKSMPVRLLDFHQKFPKPQGYAEALLKFCQQIHGSSEMQPKLCPLLANNSDSNLDKVLLDFSEIYFLAALNARVITSRDCK